MDVARAHGGARAPRFGGGGSRGRRASAFPAPAGGASRVRVGLVVFLPKASLLVDALGGGRLPSSSFQEGTLAEASFRAARYIADRYPKQALLAVNHAGALPFALENPAIDMTGLADRHIAHERSGSVHRKFDAAYVLSRKPDLVVLNSATRPGTDGVWYHPGYWEGETALVEQPAWQESYRPVDAFWEWHWVGDVSRFVVLFEKMP